MSTLSLGLFLTVLVGAGTCWYMGRRFPAVRRVGLTTAFGLITVFGFVEWRHRRALAGLSELIDPVPAVTLAVHAATAGAGQTSSAHRGPWLEHSWAIHSRLSAGEALDYYRLPLHRRGWDIHRMVPRGLSLRRDEAGLDIVVFDEGGDSLVWYFYRPPNGESGRGAGL